jgi:hypothetical protein
MQEDAAQVMVAWCSWLVSCLRVLLCGACLCVSDCARPCLFGWVCSGGWEGGWCCTLLKHESGFNSKMCTSRQNCKRTRVKLHRHKKKTSGRTRSPPTRALP